MNIESLAAVAGTAAVYTVAAAVAPPDAFNYQGVAILLGSITVFITGLVTSVLTVLTFNRQAARDKILQATHDLVDGISKEAKASAKKADFAEGKEAGVEAERQQPMVPAAAPQDSAQPVAIEEIAPEVVATITAGIKKKP
jgi:UPF0716 family protein affecting phage T7 exclusion